MQNQDTPDTNKRSVISLLVDNQGGVLARVSSLFCRRGFNIDSLTVSATNDPTISRITVTLPRQREGAEPAAFSRPSGWKSPARSLNWTRKTASSGNCFSSKYRPMSKTAPSCGRLPASTRPRSLTCPPTAWSLN